MTEPDDKELTIILSDQVREKMEADPGAAEELRDFLAKMRQAHHAVQTGQYASFDDAVEAITGVRPELIGLDDLDDEDED